MGGIIMSLSIVSNTTTGSYIQTEDGKITPTGRRNYLINGNFDSWQYGTSQTTSVYGSDDRWININGGSTKTHSRVACTDTERALFNASYFSRTVVTSITGANNQVAKRQAVENVTLLAGKTVTLSFWAKADGNKNIAIRLYQDFGVGGSPSAMVSSNQQLIALTTTWQKKTIVLNIPSIVGKTLGTDGIHTSSTGLKFYFDAGSSVVSTEGVTGMVQQSGTFDIAQVKLEDGSVATDGWHPYDGEFGGELQACQRYYEVSGTLAYSTYSTAGGSIKTPIFFKAEKRTTPTVTLLSPAYSNASSATTLSVSVQGFVLGATTTALGATQVSCYATSSAEL